MPIDERILTMPGQWAESAQVNIPNPPLPGQAYRNVNIDAANIQQGQQYDRVYDSARHNQLNYLTTGLIQQAEQYGIMPYSRNTDYPEHAICLGLDGIGYQAVQASGPNNGGAQPTSNSTYWNGVIGVSSSSAYALCEFYYFRHPALKPGFMPAQGGLIENAADRYPESWEYLLSSEGQILCKSEAEWQAMTRAIWHTNADGTQVGWNGIGGAPFYAPNIETGALRLPDLRGMYAEAVGFDALGVGGVHGDGIRNITGYIGTTVISYPNGAFYRPGEGQGTGTSGAYGYDVSMDASRVVPTAAKNQPRAWGALACVYLGGE